jgi:hypothetical protein
LFITSKSKTTVRDSILLAAVFTAPLYTI